MFTRRFQHAPTLNVVLHTQVAELVFFVVAFCSHFNSGLFLRRRGIAAAREEIKRGTTTTQVIEIILIFVLGLVGCRISRKWRAYKRWNYLFALFVWVMVR